MRIFIVTRGVPSENAPMLGIFEMDQAKALQARGHEVVLLSVDLRSIRRKRPFGFNSYIKNGIEIEEASIPLGRVPKAALLFFGEHCVKKILKKAIRKYGMPDVVHSHFADIACMTSRGLKNSGIRHIITEHSSQLNGELDQYDFNEYKKAYKSADAVITVSTALQKRLGDLFGVECKCVHNIADLGTFYCADKKKSDGKCFVSVGSLRPVKNMGNTIQAFAGVLKKVPSAKLTIIGEGPERGKLEEMISQLGLNEHVEMTGMLTREEICRHMNDSDCFVLPSISETFGVAYIEALACGLPVIASKCGGPEDFVTEKNGILLPENTVEHLTEAMLCMCEESCKYDRHVLSENIKEQFSAGTIAEQIEQIYLSQGVVHE